MNPRKLVLGKDGLEEVERQGRGGARRVTGPAAQRAAQPGAAPTHAPAVDNAELREALDRYAKEGKLSRAQMALVVGAAQHALAEDDRMATAESDLTRAWHQAQQVIVEIETTMESLDMEVPTDEEDEDET